MLTVASSDGGNCDWNRGSATQAGFPRAREKHRQLDEILIRISVRRVVRHRRRPLAVRGGHARRQRVQLEDHQAEPADTASSGQMAHQILLHLVRENFSPRMAEAPVDRRPRPGDIARAAGVRAIVIEERPDVQQVVAVDPALLELAWRAAPDG